MARSPRFKVYSEDGEYVASCKLRVDAAILVGNYGEGATVRDGHTKIIWEEGQEAILANESYDTAAETMADRAKNLPINSKEA